MSIPSIKMLRSQLGDVTFADLLPRLVCRHCRARPAPVYLCASPHRTFYGGPSPDWAIELVPPARASIQSLASEATRK